MNSTKIYLADLIHNYFLSKESFYVVPLNIGFVGSYLKNFLGNKVEVKLFKYPNRLIDTLRTETPDVVGLSYYSWNEELVLHISRRIKEMNPNILVVLGGPNIETTTDSLISFFKKHPYVDYYLPFEGEKAFANLVKAFIETRNISELKKTIILNAASYNGKLNYSVSKKTRDDECINCSSPYLTGIMDEFLKDPYLYPLFETNRGCPFSCTYCVWGSSVRNQMKRWPLHRVFDEFKYVAKHGVNRDRWILADSNFGIFERDLEIAKRLRSTSKTLSGPKSILAWNSKNTYERNIKIAEILGNINGFLVAFQTLDKDVLFNIKRHNIKENSLVKLVDYFKSKEANIETDILIGLPGETYHSHLSTLRKCFNYGIHYIRGMNIRLLPGSELATKEVKCKFGIKTKYRLNRDSYGYYWGQWIIDPEEIIQSTNAMSKEEMLKLRLIHFFIWLFWNNGILRPLLLYAGSYRINPVDLFLDLAGAGHSISSEYAAVISNYMKEASEEWFDTKEQLFEFYLKSNDIEKSLRSFSYLNFKFSPRLLFKKNIFDNIVNYIEKQIIFHSTPKTTNRILKEIKRFTINRLCLAFEKIEKFKKMYLSQNVYNYLIKEKIISGTGEVVNTPQHKNQVLIRLELKSKMLLNNKLRTAPKKGQKHNLGKIITAQFLRDLIYQT